MRPHRTAQGTRRRMRPRSRNCAVRALAACDAERLANTSHRAIALQSEGAVRGNAPFVVPRMHMRVNGIGARELIDHRSSLN
jgi:hypothetical protein